VDFGVPFIERMRALVVTERVPKSSVCVTADITRPSAKSLRIPRRNQRGNQRVYVTAATDARPTWSEVTAQAWRESKPAATPAE
jgi:hypothetical protein